MPGAEEKAGGGGIESEAQGGGQCPGAGEKAGVWEG